MVLFIWTWDAPVVNIICIKSQQWRGTLCPHLSLHIKIYRPPLHLHWPRLFTFAVTNKLILGSGGGVKITYMRAIHSAVPICMNTNNEWRTKKHWKKGKIVPQWKSLTFGSVSMVLGRWELVGEFLGENTSVTTFSIRHRCHTHHLLSHSAQQILEFLHRQILKINKTQNSKIRILLGMVYYTYLNSDC